jgi:cell fate regulator YaaT (PSP1 superfamily)
MSDNNNDLLSRGCCRTPQAFQALGVDECMKCSKLSVFNWLSGEEESGQNDSPSLVEVRFKNSRKEFFVCPSGLALKEGEVVAVESSPGHDIGVVSLTGPLVRRQMQRKGLNPDEKELKKVYRRAKQADIEKWQSAIELEGATKTRARQLASGLKLDMKINDVEYQGDKTKATFYYTAEERVDFRELIRAMAEAFQVRVEMRQIGVRQESSRLGGIGPCGRELCCASWMTEFKSVTTGLARAQQLSLNPQKLAGQCGKLKCCLNFEHDTYVDALQEFPDTRNILKTKAGDCIHQKTDIFKKKLWYSYKEESYRMHQLSIESVRRIIEMNRKGELPERLEDFTDNAENRNVTENILNQGDLNRFDHKKKR